MGYEVFLNEAKDINKNIYGNKNYGLSYKENYGLLWDAELERFIRDTQSTIQERNGMAVVTSNDSGKMFKMAIKAHVNANNETLWVDFNKTTPETESDTKERDYNLGLVPHLNMGREQCMYIIDTVPGKIRVVDSNSNGVKLVEMQTSFQRRDFIFRYNTKDVSGLPDGLTSKSIFLLEMDNVQGGM